MFEVAPFSVQACSNVMCVLHVHVFAITLHLALHTQCRSRTFDEIREDNRRRQLQQHRPHQSNPVWREGVAPLAKGGKNSIYGDYDCVLQVLGPRFVSVGTNMVTSSLKTSQ